MLTLLMPRALAAQIRTAEEEQLTVPVTRTLDPRLLTVQPATIDTVAPDTAVSVLNDRTVIDTRLSPAELTVDSRVVQSAPTARVATEAEATGAVETQAQTQQVRVSAERVSAITAGTRLDQSVRLITAAGADSVPVVEGGFQLQRGEFAVLKAGVTRRIAPLEGNLDLGVGDGPAAAEPGAPGPPSPDDSLSFFALPLRFVTPDASLTGEWVLRPIFMIGNRLHWDSDSGRFVGRFYLAVQDTAHARVSRPLPIPIQFELISDAEFVNPTTFAVEHTNLPLQHVRIRTRFAEDSVRVHIVPEFNIPGVDIWIPVAPSLTLEAPERIQGWGIETASVVARVIGTANAPRTTLTLTTTSGALDASSVPLDGSGSVSTSLRSAGLGGGRVDVGGPGFPVATRYIDFVFPWIFLLAALLGGVFGGFGAALQNSKAGSAPRWTWSVLKGIFAGVLAALAWYALGISLLQLDLGVVRFNELAVFTLAALGGYFGIPKPKLETSSAS